MRKTFVALMMLALCSFISAQIDNTMAEQSANMIEEKSKQTQQPSVQTNTTQRYRKSQWFTIGAKLGYNISLAQDKIDLDYQYSLHTGLRHGGSAGIYMRLGTNVYCQPEVLYSFTMYDASRIMGRDTLLRKIQGHTIDFPVLLGYSPVCSRTFKFRIMAGPHFAFNVNTDEKYDAIQPSNHMTSSIRKTRLGLDCGIGFDFWRITLDLRYILLQDLYKYQYKVIETNEWKQVNFPVSTFHIAIGYNIWGNNIPSSKKQKYDPNAYDFFKRNGELRR